MHAVPTARTARQSAARAARALALAGALLLGSQATAAPSDDLPYLGDASSGLVSLETERKIGEQFLRQVRAQLPLAQDPMVHYATEHLLYDLAEHSQLQNRSLRMVMIDSPTLNAFAAPGNVVGVNLGLYLSAETRDEFAAVLAHELAHLSQRHFARGVEQQRKAMLPMLAAMLASAALMATVGSDVGMAAMMGTQGAAQANALRYSRGRELEADRVGLDTLAEAGFDPHGMAAMFSRMQRAYRFDQRPPEFLLTHPVSEARISDARNQAAQYPRRQIAPDLDWSLMRARVQLRYQETPEQAVAFFRGNLATVRDMDDRPARYGLALALSAAGRHDEASAALRPLLADDPQRLAYLFAQAELLLAAKQAADAAGLLEQQLNLYPGNRPLTMLKVQALNQMGRHLDAQATLRKVTKDNPSDHVAWYHLAETAGLAGDIIAVHEARAEFFQLHGNLKKAIEHLQYALQLTRDDFHRTQQLTQRMLDLQEMQKGLG